MLNNIKPEIILRIDDLKLFFDGNYGTTQILNGISFDINQGETLGIVGESGSGKSMTAMCIMQLLKSPPARIQGSINFCGDELLKFSKKKMRSIRGNQISMIFQDPMTSLNPVFTIGNQLEEIFMLHRRKSRSEAKKESINALHMVNIPLPEKRIKDYPYQLSGGMRQRVMIAMALACQPKLLIADEPTTALDVTIQAQVLSIMRDLRDKLGTAILFITHDLGVISEMCERAVVLYCGEIMEEGPTSILLSNPKHPYTKGLLSTQPILGKKKDKLNVIPGRVPAAGFYPAGCVFSDRCKYVMDRCYLEKPCSINLGGNHTAKCFLYDK